MDNFIIRIDNLSKTFADGVQVLNNVRINIKRNEFVTLLGPSGCGKTTLLRILGGFEEQTEGDVYFEDSLLKGIPPYKRRLNTVFQKYALFPHMNVEENIAFGLTIKKVDKQVIVARIIKMLNLVNLQGFEKRKVQSLSGGQQQRVAIARALINEPEVLLLDEPLGALDLKLRKNMQIELKKIQKKLGITFIFVTHDQEEALTMSDRIVVLKNGQIQQIGTPIDIYNEPNNAFVANFIGESNIIDGIMLKDCLVEIDFIEFECVDSGFTEHERVDVVIRPEDLQIFTNQDGRIKGKVTRVTFRGVHYEIEVMTQYRTYIVHSTKLLNVFENVSLDLEPQDIHIMHKEGPDE